MQGFARVRKRAKALPDDEVLRQIKPVKSMVFGTDSRKVRQKYDKFVKLNKVK